MQPNSAAQFIVEVTQKLETLMAVISLIKPVPESRSLIKDTMEEITEAVEDGLDDFADHEIPTIFWASLSDIQHVFTRLEHYFEDFDVPYSEALQARVLAEINQWLDQIDAALPHTKPSEEEFNLIRDMADLGWYWVADSQWAYQKSMPEDWPYRHLYEG